MNNKLDLTATVDGSHNYQESSNLELIEVTDLNSYKFIELILDIGQFYKGHNVLSTISNLQQPISSAIHVAIIAEELFVILFSDLVYGYSKYPKIVISENIEKIDQIYNNILEKYKIKRPEVYLGMSLAISRYELGDNDLNSILLPSSMKVESYTQAISPIEAIRRMIEAQVLIENHTEQK